MEKVSNLTNIFQMGWNHQLDKNSEKLQPVIALHHFFGGFVGWLPWNFITYILRQLATGKMLKKSLCLLRLEVKFRQAWVHRSDCFLSLGPCRESANGRCSDGLWNFLRTVESLWIICWNDLQIYVWLDWQEKQSKCFYCICLDIHWPVWVFVSNLPWGVLNLPPIRNTFDRPPKMPLVSRNFSSRCLWRDGRFGRWKGGWSDDGGRVMILNRKGPGYFRIWKIVVGVNIVEILVPKRIPQKDDSIPGKLLFLKICDWRTSKKRQVISLELQNAELVKALRLRGAAPSSDSVVRLHEFHEASHMRHHGEIWKVPENGGFQ